MTIKDITFSNFSDNIPIGIFLFDKKMKILSWNSHLEEITHIKRKEVIGKYIFKLSPYWDFSQETKMKQLFEEKKPFNDSLLLTFHDYKISLSVNFKVVEDKKKIIAGIGTVSDEVVEMPASQLEIHENILEIISDGIITVNNKMIVTFYNATASQILSKPQDQVVGQNFLNCFPEIRGSKFETNFKYVIEHQEVKIFEFYLPPLSSWHEIRAFPFKGGAVIYFRAITDKKIIEERLIDTELKYKNIIGQTHDGIIIFDKWGILSEWNSSMELLTGIKREEALYSRLPEVMKMVKIKSLNSMSMDLFAKETYDRTFLAEWMDALAEWEITTLFGQKKILQSGVSRIDFEDDYLFVTVLRDITGNKLIQEQLEQSNENLSITLNSIGDGVITTDNTGYVTQLNPVAEKILGWKKEEASGKFITEVLRIINPMSKDSRNNPIMKVLETGKRTDITSDALLISRNKRMYHISDSAAPIKKENGEIMGVVMVFRDISKEYANERKIREMEERFRVAFKTSPDAIAITRMSDGVYVEINDGFKNLTGYSSKELIGKSALELKIWKDPKDREKLVEILYRQGYMDNLEAKFTLKDGSEITGLMSARIIMLNSERYLLSITRDISSRIKMEEELKASESRIKYILKHDPSGIVIMDRGFNVLMTSDRFLLDTEQGGHQVIGKNYLELFPDLPKKYIDLYKECLRGKVKKRSVDFFFRKNGEKEYYSWEARPWHTSSGEIGGIVLYAEVITDRINADLILKKRNEYIENILANLPIGIVALKPGTGEIYYANEPCREIFDISKKKVRKINEILKIAMIAIPEKESGLIELLQNNFSNLHELIHWEAIPIITSKKQRKLLAIYNIPLPEQEMIVLAIQDITSRKKAEEERDRLFNYSIDMLFVAGFDGYLKQINPAWEKTLGWSQDELCSQPWVSFIAQEHQQEAYSAQLELLKGKSIILFENKFMCKDGKFKWLSWNAIPLTDQNLAFGVVRDITTQKQIEEELMLRNSELNNFVYKVSHDLRAPLSSIRGLVFLMKKELPLLAEHHYIKLVENRIMKLDNFIRDILSHSKNLNTDIFISEINFHEVIENCFTELAYLENSSKIKKHIEVKGEPFFNDQVRIYEIFRNLISNSMKYMNPYVDHNYVKINITTDKDQAHICIEDNGIGIPPHMQPRIFEMFFKGTDKSDSSGIGLYIVQQAVKKLDGTVQVESESNKGTKFILMLPNQNMVKNMNVN